MYVCMYVCMYVFMYVCVYVYVSICVMFQLKEQGFTNIDAMDPSEEMLQQTMGKQLYDQLFCEYLDCASAVIPDGM